jgi:hypothetical protein
MHRSTKHTSNERASEYIRSECAGVRSGCAGNVIATTRSDGNAKSVTEDISEEEACAATIQTSTGKEHCTQPSGSLVAN